MKPGPHGSVVVRRVLWVERFVLMIRMKVLVILGERCYTVFVREVVDDGMENVRACPFRQKRRDEDLVRA